MTNTVVEPLLVDPPRPGRRRRFTAEQKRAFLDEAAQPGNSISGVARQYGISPSLMFLWKRTMESGGLTALATDGDVVAEADVRLLKQQVADLQRLLGKKTQEVEILKDALELVNSKKLPWRVGSSNNGGSR